MVMPLQQTRRFSAVLAGRMLGLKLPRLQAWLRGISREESSRRFAKGWRMTLRNGTDRRRANHTITGRKQALLAQWHETQVLAAAPNTRHRAIQRGLARAITEGDLRLDYQPQINLASNATVSMEALCRWTHPQLGRMAPDEFIGVAEASGQIMSLGRWVLDRVLADLPLIRARHPDIRVSVNVSVHELVHEHFWVWLNARLDEAAPDAAHHLEIEVTESLLVQNHDKLAQQLSALRKRGVTVAIDDFGTGHSSLARLHNLPIDKIKLDKQFVHALAVREGQIIVQAMCALASMLNKSLVVEGVETPTEREQLLALGCHIIQGYLTGAPAPLTHWLRDEAAVRADTVLRPARFRDIGSHPSG